MRRIASIFILSLFIYNTFGFLAIHQILSDHYKELGRYKVENLSGDELIERLVFNKEDIEGNIIDFTWIHPREFRYNDEMYDVVKKEEDDKQIILYCIHDEKEKRLEEEFEKRVHKNSTEDKQLPTTHSHFNILLSEPVQTEETGNDLVYESVLRFSRTDFYKSPHLDIPSPPPRTV